MAARCRLSGRPISLRHMTHSLIRLLRRPDVLAPLALALLAIGLRLLPGLRIIDDAYITYRYARNIMRGVGFVYNPGENVLGTTTPLYTVLMAMLGLLLRTEALPQISVIVNALADGANVVLLFFMVRRLLGHILPGVILGLLWAVAPKSVTFAVGGMETSVYIMAMLAAFAAWLAGHTRLSAGLTALAALTRPDALIWAGPLALAMIVERWRARRRLPWEEGVVFLGLVLPWLIYGTVRFGSPLTRSIAAKEAAYQVDELQALVTFIQHYATPFFEHETLGPSGAMIGSLLYLLLSLLGALFLLKIDRRTAPLVIFPWLYLISFSLANPLVFRWYLAPPMPVYFLCILAGLWGVSRQLFRNAGQWVVAGAGVVWLTLSVAAWELHPSHGPDRPAPEMAWFELELLYERATRELSLVVEMDTVIAVGDIGAVGWYSDAIILDTLGLVSPEATVYYPIPRSMLATTAYAVAPDLIMNEQPDYIIILEAYGRNSLMQDARFLGLYRLRDVLETDIYGSEGMLIFERVDHAPNAPESGS